MDRSSGWTPEKISDFRDIATLLGEDVGTLVEEAVREGLGDIRIRIAAERYRSGEVSVNEAALIAGVSVAVWLEIARERDLTTQLTPDDIARDAAAASDL